MWVVNVETTYITDSNLYTTRNIAPAHGPLAPHEQHITNETSYKHF